MAKKKKKESYSDLVARSLGSENSYAVYTDKFDSTLLNPIPRDTPRKESGIDVSKMKGHDIWHCHESTFLIDSGAPIAGTLKIVYPSSSEYIVESKSMKMYLNSFDMCKMGKTVNEGIVNYKNQIQRDLSKILGCEVKVEFFESGDNEMLTRDPFSMFTDLHLHLRNKIEDCEVTDYNEEKSHLEFTPSLNTTDINRLRVYTNVLRSRCRHTKQKDTGTAFIDITTRGTEVDKLSLFKEVVSLREVDEFHEFCCEKLFDKIVRHSSVIDCSVSLLYSRRGSLDINPTRYTNEKYSPKELVNHKVYTKKTQGQ